MHTPQTIDPFRAATLARQYRRAACSLRASDRIDPQLKRAADRHARDAERNARRLEASVREFADSIIAGV